MSVTNKEKTGFNLILIITVVAIIALLSQDKIAQDIDYHDFSDFRAIFNIPNFWNVLSNLPFLIVGFLGLFKLFVNNNLKIINEMKTAYALLFLGVFLVAFGSGYYHLSPNNQTLVWDRLPMTIAFMAMFAIIIAEFISIRVGKVLLWPLLIAGVASVVYWHFTEIQGLGDLRLYAFIQFYPMLVMPIILLCFKSRFTHLNAYWILFSSYALAKVFEHFDEAFYSFLGFTLSGHSIKHIVPALGLYVLLLAYQQRKELE
jgi:ceramidase